MENASKALLIAGAILLAILLISLGILIYNNAKGTIAESNLDMESAYVFNSKFTSYCGENKKGSEINALVDVIASTNGSQAQKGGKHYIILSVSRLINGASNWRRLWRRGCI